MLKKVLFVLLILFSFSLAATQGSLEFRPIKKNFNKSEDICFYLKNNSGEKIYLPSSAPWAVFEDKDFEKIIFSPIATQSIVEIKPSQKKKWCWKQKDFNNEQVPSGEYTIRLTVFKSGKRLFLSSTVNIKNSAK
ncbi:hypothetical protein SAMN06265182_2043 [Persephonella hydrogeniphila]|uniref:Intracellular proteinase inhibitor n=1 Tax=Persephonella hydrogeniphila TaxID=198703 RepID=A0A285NTX8_9AQUI|nr:hypothetical protein [Persephonella hydrogeniphila]SNZ11356.1 hypothetical protein SAMN06265182_2043 [Persephonella hydrogeniphila]